MRLHVALFISKFDFAQGINYQKCKFDQNLNYDDFLTHPLPPKAKFGIRIKPLVCCFMPNFILPLGSRNGQNCTFYEILNFGGSCTNPPSLIGPNLAQEMMYTTTPNFILISMHCWVNVSSE